jgi:probable F420-dependent oxidoreductase
VSGEVAALPSEELPAEQLTELSFYALAGHSDSPRDLLGEVRQGEDLGIGSALVSERFNLKDAPTLCGAAAAVSETIGIATAATNHNTRHPLVTATFATTMHRLTGGRFALGLGRGFDSLFKAMGLEPITSAQIEDAVSIYRRLWRGEAITQHEGPAGRYPYLQQDPELDEEIPILLVAMGEKSLELAGGCMDAVVLHTFFGDEALTRSVAAVRRGAERAGRDPANVRVWSVLATVGDHVDEDKRLKKTVGRLASYLRGYGDLLVRVNGWDPVVLERFRSDPLIQGFQGAVDARATVSELEHIATLLPEEWLAASATGSPEQCSAAILRQFELGADSVCLHGASPAELAPVLEAYRSARPEAIEGMPANPGWSR